MANNSNKKPTNRTTAKKHKYSSKKKKGNTNTIIISVIGIVCIGAVLVTNIVNNKTNNEDGTGVTNPNVTIVPTNELTPTIMIEPTVTVKPTTTPEPTDSLTVTPTPIMQLSETEALKLVQKAISDDTYKISITSDKLSIDGDEYFSYRISYEDKELEPQIIVMKDNGSIFYYDTAGVVSSFTKFPLDNVEIVSPEGEEISKEAAVERAAKLPRAVLGLEKELSDYTVEVDDWTTMVKGKNSYCLNVFDKTGSTKQLVGIYYVTEDGSDVYWLDEEKQEFVLLSE